MLSNVGKIIIDKHAVNQAANFHFGLEVESDRATRDGWISRADYPTNIGTSDENPWITTDFLQAMTEVVTPPATSAEDALYYLTRINNALRNALHDNEILWPLSMPPRFYPGRGKELNANPNPHKHKFFTDWVDKHSFHGGTPCGVHVNMSINNLVLDLILANSKFKSKQDLKTALYLRIGQGFFKYRWVITYLFGATPLAEANYFEDDNHPHHPIRSLRQSSQYGYGVNFTADFTNLATYVKTLKQAYRDHILLLQSEGHGPVRYKGDADLDQMLKKGIQYVELRMLDLNPTSSVGVSLETLSFFRLLATYFMLNQPIAPKDVSTELTTANQLNDVVADERPDECHLQKQLLTFIDELNQFVSQVEIGAQYQSLLDLLRQKVIQPELTPSAQLVTHSKNHSLLDYALKLGKRYQADGKAALNPFSGFKDDPGMKGEVLKKKL